MRSVFRSSTRLVIIVILVLLLLLSVHLSSLTPLLQWRPRSSGLMKAAEDLDPNAPPCQSLKGGEDVVVVMRTGATEIKDKLPVHLNTTFQCYPDTLIFSDFEEIFNGYQVYDVLAAVNDNVKQTNLDFEHYLRLQRLGRTGLEASELHGESYESGPVGKNDNPGWRLDKWKFLPMIVRTLELRPQKKWYVFVEPDTYIVWSNLVQWLQRLNPAKPLYFGSEVQIGDDIFAHGGSAFVLSHSAMQKAAAMYLSDPEEWHTRTSMHWAGDCILGTALAHAGVGLTWSWPMFQGGNPADMRWDDRKAERRLWCAPALSYHHLAPYQVETFWAYEQERIKNITAQPPSRSIFWGHQEDRLLHRDVFRTFVLPNITEERSDWSNGSPELVPNSQAFSMSSCRSVCEFNEGCMQYALGPIGCSVAGEPRLGAVAPRVQSGWMTDRIETWMSGYSSCRGRTGWLVT